MSRRRSATLSAKSHRREVSILAGRPGQKGSADGPGATARFNAPKAVAVDKAGSPHSCRLAALPGWRKWTITRLRSTLADTRAGATRWLEHYP
jgi:hypothetical protein